MSEIQKNETIFSINTKDKFLKVKGAFGIGKIQCSFVQFDKTKEHGDQIVAQADFYLSIEEAKYLAFAILSDKIPKAIAKAKSSENKFPEAIWKSQGGISAEACRNRQTRTDGMALARVMSILPGSKFPYVFKIEQGPGKETEEGLIVPQWKKPEVAMFIPCDAQTFYQFALMIDAAINADMTTKQVEAMFEKRAAAKKKN